MSEPLVDAIFVTCKAVIEFRGQLTRINELKFAQFYKDEKIVVAGYIDVFAALLEAQK